MKQLFILICISILASSQAISQNKHIMYQVNKGDTLHGILNEKGEVILENKYNYLVSFKNYIINYNKPNTLFSPQGTLIIDSIGLFYPLSNNRHLFIQNYTTKKWALYTKEGAQITDYKYTHGKSIGSAYVQIKFDNKYIIIDTLGNVFKDSIALENIDEKLIQFKSEYNIPDIVKAEAGAEYMPYEEPLKVFKDTTTQKYGLRQYNEIIIKAMYDNIHSYPRYGGFFIVQKNGKEGLLNSNGKVILDPKYDEVKRPSDFYVIAVLNGKYGMYYAPTQELVIPHKYAYLGFNQ